MNNLEVLTVDIEAMPRADLPAIWDAAHWPTFRETVEDAIMLREHLSGPAAESNVNEP